LVQDVIPTVEAKYRVAPGRRNRPIAGLSISGAVPSYGARAFGLVQRGRLLLGAPFPADFETRFAKLKVLWIGCGQQDSLFSRSKTISDLLNKHEIKDVFRAGDGVHNYTGGAVCPNICRCCFAN
jgi:hypothetical protein